MRKKILKLCFALTLVTTPVVVLGVPFTFSYDFDDGSSLTGILDGIVQSDNDTIEVIDFSSASWNGFSFPDIAPDEFSAVSDFPAGLLPPTVSFSGNTFDLFVCPLGFSQTGNCSFGADSGFLLGLMANFGQGGLVPAFAIGDGQGNGLIGPINPLAWSISRVRQNNIPEARVIWLLTLGLLMLRQKVFFI